MKNVLEFRVYYSDTDSYGVVWHGSYLRYMEAGRVELCRDLGLDLVELKNNDITIPVTNLNIRYKAPAKIEDEIIVETSVSKVSPLTITFLQTIKDKKNNKVLTIAEVEVVAVTNEGKIYRRMPDILKQTCLRAMNN